ncbi:hypothetical protein C5748_27030 [Phyllobacterium phragmitis]|uniref:Uncharacterized protein n=1 Tax=Phyllobacterium phragmitis TaxID=2670329 RepID=A0A2S9IIS5_9HYPH|nr:hypothetical protein [Phyllobacterium phragmitis]PRD40433.1 hypothetical protein C5748_27030 [Phyllobacterium phragmitis]
MGIIHTGTRFSIPKFLAETDTIRPNLREEHALAIQIAESALQVAYACQAFPQTDFVQIGCYGRLFVERSRFVGSMTAFQTFLNNKAGS